MRGSLALSLVVLTCVGAAQARADNADEVTLPAPPIVAVNKKATPWMRSQIAQIRSVFTARRPIRARNVARLPLALPGGRGNAWFVTYRLAGGGLCAVQLFSVPGGGGWATGGVPCLPGLQCAVCVGGGSANGEEGWLVFTATVPPAGDSLRLTLEDATAYRFVLTGPLIGRAPARRVVMVQLATRSRPRLVEVFRADDLLVREPLGSS